MITAVAILRINGTATMISHFIVNKFIQDKKQTALVNFEFVKNLKALTLSHFKVH